VIYFFDKPATGSLPIMFRYTIRNDKLIGRHRRRRQRRSGEFVTSTIIPTLVALVVTLAVVVPGASSAEAVAAVGCDSTLVGCYYLHDLATGGQEEIALLFDQVTTLSYDDRLVSSGHEPSIWCDTTATTTTTTTADYNNDYYSNGGTTSTTSPTNPVQEVEFAVLPAGVTYTTRTAPYWLDVTSAGLGMDKWLQSCGDKILSVEGKNSYGDTCFRATFRLYTTCPYGGGGSNAGAGNIDNNYTNNTNPIITLNNTTNNNEIGDLNLRFSKIARDVKDNPPVFIQPRLTSTDYPIGGALGVRLARQTTAVSVMLADDYELRGFNVLGYVNRVGIGAPTMPNRDPNHPFWADFRAVVQAQVRRRNGDMSDLNLPQIWRDMQFNVTGVALAIQNELPGLWQALLIDRLFKEGAKLDTNVLPFRSKMEFIGGVVRMAEINFWTIIKVSPVNFRLKWIYGRPRPEEVAYQIQNGDISAWAVPDDILQTLSRWNLTRPDDFTAYRTGSPQHPSWPAMHSTASMASFWLMVVLDMTEEEKCQALLTDWIVSYGRTVAGVHYPTDNISGLNLGQEIVAEILVDHLVDLYNANRTAAQAKVAASRFDWSDFDPATCRINKRN
jgi:PAP2 superfamily